MTIAEPARSRLFEATALFARVRFWRMSSSRRAAALSGLVGLLGSGAAFAGTASVASTAQLMGQMDKIMNPVIHAGQQFSTNLVPMGLDFLAFAILVELALLVMAYLIAGGIQETMVLLVGLFFRMAIPIYLLSTWPTPLLQAEAFFSHTVFAALGVGSLSSMLAVATTSVVHAIANLVMLPPAPIHLLTPEFWKIPSNISDYITGSAGVLLTDLLIIVLVGGTSMLLILALFIALYGPLVFISLGLVFGPILICWMPWRALSGLAHAWMVYMIEASFALAVGAAVADIFIRALNLLGSQFQSGLGSLAGPHTPAGQQAYAMVDTALVFLVPTTAVILFMVHMVMNFEHMAATLTGGSGVSANHNLAKAAVSTARLAGK